MTAGEASLACVGDDARPTVLILPPLFDEANRMRRTIVQMMRALSTLGIASILPDLPAQNDSLLPNEQASLTLWRAAVAQTAAALPGPFVVASWRGGALIDDAATGARGWWRMAPQGGSAILKGLLRTRIAGDREAGRATTGDDLRAAARRDGWVELGGYRLSATMLDELDTAAPAAIAPLRIVSPAEVRGSALWLRAEPGEDATMAGGMAHDIADWLATIASADDTAAPSPERAAAPIPGDPSKQRRQIGFDVGGDRCAATIDHGDHASGLLIVSGGNEIRSGAHRGMAELAAAVAQAGHPVMRFDRRGVGDSEGENGGFTQSAADLAAGLHAFRDECPAMQRVVAFGNCDAAAALLLHLDQARPDALVLANIWTIEAAEADDEDAHDHDGMPPAAAIRARYAQKLRDPREWLRLLRGGVDLAKLWRGLKAARTPAPSGLAERLGAALAATNLPVTIVIAEGDGTARAFLAQWNGPAFAQARAGGKAILQRHPTGSHGFADDAARAWLHAQLLGALRQTD
jgi:exosortase A-associated hydrolase 1